MRTSLCRVRDDSADGSEEQIAATTGEVVRWSDEAGTVHKRIVPTAQEQEREPHILITGDVRIVRIVRTRTVEVRIVK